MSRTEKKHYIYYTEFAASCLIVFIHIRFPGLPGDILECFSRLSIILFFAIAGYFSYEVKSYGIGNKLKKMLVILFIADLIYLGWGMIFSRFVEKQGIRTYLYSLARIDRIALFLLTDIRTRLFSYHLRYLTILIKINLILYFFLRVNHNRFSYGLLYLSAFTSLILFVSLNRNAAISGLDSDLFILRNGIIFGIVPFMLGLLLHNYEERIISVYSLNKPKLIIMFLIGYALSFLEWFGIRKTEMPLGMLLTAISLILLPKFISFEAKEEKNKSFFHCSDLETVSIVIFIIHPLVFYFMNTFDVFQVVMQKEWLVPLVVLVCSILTGATFCFLCKIIKNLWGIIQTSDSQ